MQEFTCCNQFNGLATATIKLETVALCVDNVTTTGTAMFVLPAFKHSHISAAHQFLQNYQITQFTLIVCLTNMEATMLHHPAGGFLCGLTEE